VTNAAVNLIDPCTSTLLKTLPLAAGGTLDTGWKCAKIDTTEYVGGCPSIEIRPSMDDGWPKPLAPRSLVRQLEFVSPCIVSSE